MKKPIMIMGLAVTMLVLSVLPVFAGEGEAPATGCQPGADNGIIEAWQLLSLEEYAELLFIEGSAPDYQSALVRATATYNFCDRNGDGYACVMEQNLPKDANGSSHWFLIEDNHPFSDR